MLNGGLWRVCFSNVRKLLILEREMGFEPTTSSLGSWHSTTELLPRSCRIVQELFSHTIPQSGAVPAA